MHIRRMSETGFVEQFAHLLFFQLKALMAFRIHLLDEFYWITKLTKHTQALICDINVENNH